MGSNKQSDHRRQSDIGKTVYMGSSDRGYPGNCRSRIDLDIYLKAQIQVAETCCNGSTVGKDICNVSSYRVDDMSDISTTLLAIGEIALFIMILFLFYERRIRRWTVRVRKFYNDFKKGRTK